MSNFYFQAYAEQNKNSKVFDKYLNLSNFILYTDTRSQTEYIKI